MNQLDDILTTPTALLLLALYITSFALRRLVEVVWPTLVTAVPVTRGQHLWKDAVLPTLPALLGFLFCITCPPALFTYPKVVVVSWVSRALYGLGLGWFTAWGYRVVKAILQKRWNVPFPDDAGGNVATPKPPAAPTP